LIVLILADEATKICKPTAHLNNPLILPGDFFLPFGGKLVEEIRWVQLA